jgi:hypothetical protein
VGHIAIQAAYDLVFKEKLAGFLCLAAMGAHHEGMVKSGKQADIIVAMDGCPIQCATKTLQNAGIEPAIQVIVTKLGIEKPTQDIALMKWSAQGNRESKEELASWNLDEMKYYIDLVLLYLTAVSLDLQFDRTITKK